MIKLDSVSEQTEQGLKPCPFCGGEAVLINTRAFGESCKSVMCIKCRATVSNFAGDTQEERKLKPVEGWKAKKRIICGQKKPIETFHIVECPLYEKEGRKKR